MAVGHSQWSVFSSQPYKSGRYSTATAASWLLFAATTETTPCVHGGVAGDTSVCQTRRGSICLHAKGTNLLCIHDVGQQLSGVQNVDWEHPQYISVDLVPLLTRNREAKGKVKEIQERRGNSLPHRLSVAIIAMATQQLTKHNTANANVHALMYKEEERAKVKEWSTKEQWKGHQRGTIRVRALLWGPYCMWRLPK